MKILYLLIPLSVLLVFAIIYGLWWAVNKGQFEKLDNRGYSILDDEKNSDETNESEK